MAADAPETTSEEPWAVSGLLYGLADVVDRDKRPILERRASTDARKGVPMDVRVCPYADERKGQLMNVSALAQISKNLRPALREIAAFRAAQEETEPNWLTLFTAVLDQLSGPARFLLTAPEAGPVPVQVAVGHKLAAGFFGVSRSLLRDEALGETIPYRLDAFLEYVKAKEFLVGANEVCAGPPHMIAQTSEVFMFGDPAVEERASARRLTVARGVASQVRLGLVWELFDALTERALLGLGERLAPKSSYLRRQLDRRTEALAASGRAPTRDDVLRAIPLHEATGGIELRDAIERAEPHPFAVDLAELIARDEGAITVAAAEDRVAVAQILCDFLAVYRQILEKLWRIERTLRLELGRPLDAAMALNVTVCPLSRGKPWLEAILGHRIEVAPGEAPAVTFTSRQRTLTLG